MCNLKGIALMCIRILDALLQKFIYYFRCMYVSIYVYAGFRFNHVVLFRSYGELTCIAQSVSALSQRMQ